MTRRALPPPAQVLAAFGAVGPVMPLAGGRGTAWRAGDIVVKPAEGSELMLAWQSKALTEIGDDRLRLALPRASRYEAFVVEGWSASTFCVGAHDQRRWLDVIAAGGVLHSRLADIACPDVVLARDDPWSIADRAAWGEVPLSPYLNVPHVARLASRLEPVGAGAGAADPRRPDRQRPVRRPASTRRDRPVALLAACRLRDCDCRRRCPRMGGSRSLGLRCTSSRPPGSGSFLPAPSCSASSPIGSWIRAQRFVSDLPTRRWQIRPSWQSTRGIPTGPDAHANALVRERRLVSPSDRATQAGLIDRHASDHGQAGERGERANRPSALGGRAG